MSRHNPPQIDTATLRKLMDEGAVRIVEVNLPQEFRRGHIPGAIFINFAMIGRSAAANFSKEETIVAYCKDENCRASHIAADKLQSLGYTNAYHYAGGKRAWAEAGYELVEGEEEE